MLFLRVASACSLALIAGCAGVSLRPELANADTLPVYELSAADQQELAVVLDRAKEAMVRQHYEEAEEHALRALDIDPRAARARAVVGMVLLQRAKRRDPPEVFEANAGETEMLLAEQIAPNDAFVGRMRAVFLAETGHMSAAAAAAEAALLRATDAPAADRAALLAIAGNCRYELGEERAALPHLQACFGLQPDDATTAFRIGSCLFRIAAVPEGAKAVEVAQIKAEEAARAFARCAELAPGDADAALAVGAALVRAAELAAQRKDLAAPERRTQQEQRWQQAEQQFRRVAERFPESAEPMFRLGVLAETRGDIPASHQAYLQALVRDHQHLGSLLNLAALLEASGDAAAAASLLERALAADAARAGLSAGERRLVQQRLRRP
ncbi:MAG TPA: tetratricopeptide repeat protein [Planctomycetota bacterium]|nr:tetratricopeptide repeat protein [Planctomycetota bacterium]